MKIRAAVIGCGDMGGRHARAWHSRSDAEVVAVFDPVEESRSKLAAEVGASAYDSYRDAILHEVVDVVSVCTPLPYHAEVSIFAAEHGRHVLCEKPLAPTLEDADRMVEAAARHRVLLSTSLQTRSFPRYRRLRRIIQEGELGAPLMARLVSAASVRPKIAMHRRSQNNGPVMDITPHFVDRMRYLTGAEVRRVSAVGDTFGRGKPQIAEVPDEDLAMDIADIRVEFEGGHVLSMLLCWGLPVEVRPYTSEMIVGPQGRAHQGPEGLVVSTCSGEEVLSAENGGPELRIDQLAEAIGGRAPLEVTGEDGREATRVALAALESIATGRVVDLR